MKKMKHQMHNYSERALFQLIGDVDRRIKVTAERKHLVNLCLARAPARCALRAICDVLPPPRPGLRLA